jgi:type I restriction enzyme S subunit
MTDLPSGWVSTSLGDICERISDGSHNPPKKQSTGLPMLSAININANSIKFDSYRLISEAEFEIEDRRTQVQTDDVLLTIVGAIGRAAVVPKSAQKFTLQRSVAVLRSGAMLPRLLMHHLEEPTTAKFFKENARGTAQKGIYLKTLASTPILLPPLNEQHRIVEKIEAMFDEIDKGVESLQTARATLGLYRQSLLKSAFEGRLTADWRTQNADKLESPETLLARIQKERDTRHKAALDAWQDALAKWRAGGEKGKKLAKPKRPRDIPAKATDIGIHGWTMMPLGLLIDEPAYGTSKKSDYDGGNKGVLRIPNIAAGVIDATDLKSSNFDEAELEQYQLIEGDVLTIRSNGSLSLVGKPALVRPVDTQFVYAGYLIRLRPIPGSLVPKNLVYLMMEPTVRGQIENKAKSTSGVNNINAKELQELQVPICSADEQSEIVRILDARLEAADALEAEIDAALTRADALRQSILKKAFSGQLVPQDPDDEPASALLERIKAEKKERENSAKEARTSRPVRVAEPRRPKLTDLLDVLKQQKSWTPASKAAEGLGLGDGASSDDIEAFYHQLKQYVESSAIEIERRGDEDWLRLAEVEAN